MTNQYGIIAAHEAATCPFASRAARDSSKKLLQAMPSLFQKYNLKMLNGDHFDPEHLTIIRLDDHNG
jgi:hypothetical protein